MPFDAYDTTVVALLHDVVEDTEYTLIDLIQRGFSTKVIDALKLMTHDDSVPYLEYVDNLKHNPIARTVKLADLRHNSDLSRLKRVDEKALERVQKYKKAIHILEENIGYETAIEAVRRIAESGLFEE